MGHCIQGIVGNPGSILAASSGHQWPTPFKLRQGFLFVPFYNPVLDAVATHMDPILPGFTYLGPELHRALSICSAKAAFAYLETDYFGGAGAQGAVAYKNGGVVFGPAAGNEGQINAALRLIGVSRGSLIDEFEAIGLAEIRRMDDFCDFEKFQEP